MPETPEPPEAVPGRGSSSVASAGGIGAYEWDPVTRSLWWDPTAARIFGMPPFDPSALESQMLTWQQRVHPDDRQQVHERFLQLQPHEMTFRIVLDDGSVRMILSRATQVRLGATGEPERMAGVAIDVTAVHEAARLAVDVLESISEAFCGLDHDFGFTYVNRAAEQVLGRERGQLLGRSAWEVFPEMLGTTFETTYRQVMDDRSPQVFEAYYPAPLERWFEVRVYPTSAPGGLAVYFRDVTLRRAAETEREDLLVAERDARRVAEGAQAQLAYQATHDPLTGLLNRAEMSDRARRHLASEPNRRVTALFLDLDRFKLINDSLGHAAGDALLIALSDRLSALLGPDELLARIGGDEFVVLQLGGDEASAEALATRLLESVRSPLEVLGRRQSVSASIGLAGCTAPGTFELLLRDADVALYRAKDAGRNRFAWFDARAHRDLMERIALEADLRQVLADRGLEVHFQPVLELPSRRPCGVEALVRWAHPVRGWVPPSDFIPLAEDTGLIWPLTSQVLEGACAEAAGWSDLPDFTVWVNVSGTQLGTLGLTDLVERELEKAGLAPHRLGIEVTESVLADEEGAAAELNQLAALGIRLAIDDFGTGYSSLARLNRYPIDVLKIDRSFVSQLHTAPGAAAVNAIIQLGHALGMRIVAEGVEEPEQLQALVDAGSDAASGYLLGRPAAADQLDLRAGAAPGRP